MIDMKQFTLTYKDLVVDKKKLVSNNRLDRIEVVLYYQDEVLLVQSIEDSFSLDQTKNLVRLKCTLSTLAMATSVSIKGYNDQDFVIKLIKKQYVL